MVVMQMTRVMTMANMTTIMTINDNANVVQRCVANSGDANYIDNGDDDNDKMLTSMPMLMPMTMTMMVMMTIRRQ